MWSVGFLPCARLLAGQNLPTSKICSFCSILACAHFRLCYFSST